jgi:Polyketide cyclase / dehydrase and lipid transport
MKRISTTHRYDVPVERAFAFITNLENWWKFWPGYVRLEPGSRWNASGDGARLVVRLLGRERELALTLTTFEPNRLVAYTSRQAGLPNARHERHFEPDSDGFLYRLVVEYEPRASLAWIFDATLLPLAIRRAFRRTFTLLEQEFRRTPA